MNFRLYILKNNADSSRLMERVNDTSVSTKKIDLYGRKLLLTWPDTGVIISDPSIEGSAAINGEFILSSREWKEQNTLISVDGVEIGSDSVVIAAGPCSIDFEDGVEEFSSSLKKAGADIIRGGAFKPRTSPFTFQGKGETGLKILRRMKDATGMPTVSEILDTDNLGHFRDVDILQIGSRNAQNFRLLQKVSKADKPILLKRGMGNTYSEWMATADYVLGEGNGSVILCERGIRTFENATRFTLDVGSIAKARMESHLPICSDPSHASGERAFVIPLALASVAAGANMLLVEVHPDPEKALSDAKQQLTIDELKKLTSQVRLLEKTLRR